MTDAPTTPYVLFLPPLAGLAGLGLSKLHRIPQTITLVLFLVASGVWFGQAWIHRAYSRRDAARTLAQTLPPGSIVTGDLAPALCLDTNFAAAPVQVGLSNDLDPIESLHAGYVAIVRAPVWDRWWSAHYPALMRPSQRVATFTLSAPRHFLVDVYAVHAQEKPANMPNGPYPLKGGNVHDSH